MPRLPSFVTRVDTAHGVRYEARINTTLATQLMIDRGGAASS
jgi:hypothetical protein